MSNNKTFIISGGGTGGHIFPAVSIAGELGNKYPNAKIHFIGALGKMEMERVPAAGYPITGIPIMGINRKKPWKSIKVPFLLLKALWQCRSIMKKMKPDAVIGTGGYASGPALWVAQRMGIPTLIQEQNSYAGVTNKALGKRANYICTAYENAAKFFPAGKVRLTGNPVRQQMLAGFPEAVASANKLGLSGEKPVLLVLGGSLGARAINRQMKESVQALLAQGWEIYWQCGKLYIDEYKALNAPGVVVVDFISDMASAYGAATTIVSRAGAGTLSELCIVGKPAVLVPSPNVAENHQWHNANALSGKGAAVLLEEKEMAEAFESILAGLLGDSDQRAALAKQCKAMALPQATASIVELIDEMC